MACCRKPVRIAHNTAAEQAVSYRDHGVLQQCGKDGIQYRQAFTLLAIGQKLHCRLSRPPAQAGGERGQDKAEPASHW